MRVKSAYCVVRGITIDGSALPTGQMLAVGDKVELLGTVDAGGKSVTATSIVHDGPAAAARLILAGPLTSVAAGSAAGTYAATILGQTISVDAATRIADRTVFPPPTFNINNFQTGSGRTERTA
jgi:hypothetical protein